MATQLLRPGYEILYPKGVPYGDVKAVFSGVYGIPLESVAIREDGGGIYCSEEVEDGGQIGQCDNDDILGIGDSGDSGQPACAGISEVTG